MYNRQLCTKFVQIRITITIQFNNFTKKYNLTSQLARTVVQ